MPPRVYGQARSGTTRTPAVPGAYGSVTCSPEGFTVVGTHSFPEPIRQDADIKLLERLTVDDLLTLLAVRG